MGNDRAMELVRACRNWQARTRGVQVWIMPLRQALTRARQMRGKWAGFAMGRRRPGGKVRVNRY
jgi:hypothetical protein